MPKIDTARNLLQGALAMQMELVTQDELFTAIHRWMGDQSQNLDQVLSEQGSLSDEARARLAPLVEKFLQAQSGADPVLESTVVPADSESVRPPNDHRSPDPIFAATCSFDPPTLGSRLGSVGESTSRGNRFQILRPLAKGGLGQVSMAQDNELNREVALKEIQDRHADNADSRFRFVREAEITGGLEHPGIVPVYGLGQDGAGRPFYAMRFIKGDSLSQAIHRYHQRGSAPQSEQGRAMEFRGLLGRLVDVCNTMEYAHARGVLHRDLKPANVMLGNYGETLVVDWGLAKATGREDHERGSSEAALRPSSGSGLATQAGRVVGTPAFMSPEQAAGKLDEVGPSSDVYSLGATLYELLTGQPPVTGKNLTDVLRKVQAGEITAPREVNPQTPKALDAICRRAMATRPDDRYGSPKEIADDVERFLADEPVTAYAEPVVMATRRWLRKHPRIVAFLAASLLIGLTSTVVIAAVVSDRNQQLASANEHLSQANAAEIAAKGNAELRRQEAERAQKKAQRHFDLALESIGTFHAGVTGDALLEQEELNDLKKKLLRGPLAFYKRLRTDLKGSGDEKSRNALGEAYVGIATITLRVGSNADAVEAFEQAAAMYEQLVKEFPNVPEHQHRLAVCYGNLCNLRTETGHSAEAFTAIHRAIEVLNQLIEKNPARAEYRHHLISTYNNLGIVQQRIDKPLAAIESFQQVIDLSKQLLATHPTVAEYRSLLAVGHFSLGSAQVATDQQVQAIESFGRAIEIQQQLVEEDDSQIEFQHRLGLFCGNLGALYGMRENYELSLQWTQRALEMRQKVVGRHPNVTAYQSALASTYDSLASLQVSAGQSGEALKLLNLALAIKTQIAEQHPAVIQHRGDLASSFYNRGILQSKMQQPVESSQSYQQAIAISQQLLDEHPDLSDSWTNLARSYTNLGNLQRDSKQYPAALISFQQAIKFGKKLVAELEFHQGTAIDLGKSYSGLAELYLQMGTTEKAMETFQQAIEVRTKLADKYPQVTEYQTDLANTYAQYGEAHIQTGQPSQAIAPYLEIIKIREAIVRQHPKLIESRDLLASTYVALGNLYEQIGQLKEIVPWFEKASKLREKLLAERPQDSDLAVTLGGNYCNLGIYVRLSGGKLVDSEDWLNKAIARLSDIVMKEGSNARAKLFLRNSYYSRAETRMDLGRYKDAIEDWSRTLELDSGSALGYLRLQRAKARALLQDHAGAAQEADEVQPSARSGEGKLNVARVFALASAAAGKDQQLPEAERQQRSEKHAARAMEILADIRKMDFFKNPANLDSLKTDPDLAPLRSREDFKKLLTELTNELNKQP